MLKFSAVLLCLVALSCAGKQSKVVVAEQQPQASHGYGEISADFGDDSGYYEHSYGGCGGKAYASSAELTSLAHSSALQAKSAVRSQQTAGSQAAFGAKSNLAQAALGAAATAQAALVGKQVIVQHLENRLHGAEKQLQSEIGQYHQTKQVAIAALEASYQAQQQVNAITSALTAAQGSSQHATQAAAEAAGAAAAQHSMIQEAKQRLAKILKQLHIALSELQETEYSAEKAAAAAQIAQGNAAAAANAVAANAEKSQSQSHYYH